MELPYHMYHARTELDTRPYLLAGGPTTPTLRGARGPNRTWSDARSNTETRALLFIIWIFTNIIFFEVWFFKV